MGLAEKRAAKTFQDSRFPEFQKEVKAVTGKAVPVEVNWESLMWEGCQDVYNDNWANGCFLPLVDALKSLCSDELGSKAIKDNLKKIEVSGDYAHSLKAEFDGGTLKLDFAFYGEGAAGGPGSSDFEDRVKTICDTMEKAL